jgi:murein L,D-transpeptidase YafK
VLGPKLREGDRQVPEGVYRIASLNPNSRFHLSMEVNYPNDFDRAMAAKDGRVNLGGQIFIHGGTASIGCLAMGDAVIERLFVLVARVGRENVRVVIAPGEPVGTRFPSALVNSVPWAVDLQATILDELRVIRGFTGA